MNGLLQSLFHAGEFRLELCLATDFDKHTRPVLRRIVYSIECEKEEKDTLSRSVAEPACHTIACRKEDAPMDRAGDTDAEGALLDAPCRVSGVQFVYLAFSVRRHFPDPGAKWHSYNDQVLFNCQLYAGFAERLLQTANVRTGIGAWTWEFPTIRGP